MLRHLSPCGIAAMITVIAATSAPAQAPPALVELAPVVEQELSEGKTFSGTVVPPRVSVVGSAVDGRVESADFEEGDRVRMTAKSPDANQQGQPLVQLRTRTISLELAVAGARLEAQSQRYAELGTSIPIEIAQAKANVLAASAQLDYHRARFTRTSVLYKSGNASTQEEVDEAQAAWIAAQQELELAKSKRDQLEATRGTRLAQARAAQRAAEEEVNRLKDIKDKYTIRAPFDGFVTRKLTEVGAWLSQGDPVAEVIELNPAEIDVFVPEQYISKVKVGSAVSVSAGALPDRVFVGEVTRIVPQADLRSRSFPVKVRLDNPQFELKAGMLVRASLRLGDEQPVLMVSKDALVLSGSERTVVVADKDSNSGQLVARFVPVVVGTADGALIQVSGDLRAGDRVVVRGNERLRPGQVLKPLEASRRGKAQP